MRPLFEKVTVPDGASWSLLHRRLDDGIPFLWHYHPEFELTLTLNSRGQRYIGDSIPNYDDGDLVLLGPNLPHTWCSAERIDARRAARRGRHVVHRELGGKRALRRFAEMRPVAALLARAGRGIVFSRRAAEAARPLIESIPAAAVADRLLVLMQVLVLLAGDRGAKPIAGPAADRRSVGSPDRPASSACSITSTPTIASRSRFARWPTWPRSASRASTASSAATRG